jgi:hypothetical protein
MPNNVTIQLEVRGGREARQALSQIARSVRDTAREAEGAGTAGAGAWGALLGAFGRAREALAPAREGFGELRRSVGEFRESLVNVADRVFPHFREIAELATAASAAGFVELAKSSAEGVRATQNAARSLGLTVEQYEGLRLVAAKAGVDQETFNTGLARFSRAMGAARIAARQGGTAAAEAAKPFRELGISIGGSVGKMWTAEGGDIGQTLPALIRVTGALSRVADANQQAALSTQFFGREWLKIIPAFAGDVDRELTAANATIARFGIGLDKEEEDQAARFNAAWTTMETVVDRVKEMVGNAVGAALVPAIEHFTEIIGTNSGAIREWAASIAATAKPVLDDFITLIKTGDRAQLNTGFVRGLYDLATGVKVAFAGLIAVLNQLAAVINSVFGTQITGGMLLSIALVGQFTGAFGLLINALQVARIVGGIFWGLMISNPAIAIPLLAAVIALMVDWNGAFHNIAITADAFWGLMKSFSFWVARGFYAAWAAALGFIEDHLKGVVNWLLKVYDAAKKTLSAIGSAGATAVTPGYAAGGPVIGAGGTDNVPIWASDGEYVVRAAAVARYGRGVFDRLNSLRFAEGGLVATPYDPYAGASYTQVSSGPGGGQELGHGIDPGLAGNADLVSSILGQAQADKAVESHPYEAPSAGARVMTALGRILGSSGAQALTEGILPQGITPDMIKAVQVGNTPGSSWQHPGGRTARLELALPNGQSVWLNGNPNDITTIINYTRLQRLISGGKKPSSMSS